MGFLDCRLAIACSIYIHSQAKRAEIIITNSLTMCIVRTQIEAKSTCWTNNFLFFPTVLFEMLNSWPVDQVSVMGLPGNWKRCEAMSHLLCCRWLSSQELLPWMYLDKRHWSTGEKPVQVSLCSISSTVQKNLSDILQGSKVLHKYQCSVVLYTGKSTFHNTELLKELCIYTNQGRSSCKWRHAISIPKIV